MKTDWVIFCFWVIHCFWVICSALLSVLRYSLFMSYNLFWVIICFWVILCFWVTFCFWVFSVSERLLLWLKIFMVAVIYSRVVLHSIALYDAAKLSYIVGQSHSFNIVAPGNVPLCLSTKKMMVLLFYACF